MDVLSDILRRSRARGALFSHSTVSGEWGVRFPAGPRVAVHVIVAGEAHLWAEDDHRQSLRVGAGDIVLARESLSHAMAHAPGAACIPFAELPRGDGARARLLTGHGDGPEAVFFCGAYDFQGDLLRPLLNTLPRTFRVRPAPGSTLRATVDLLGREILQEQLGQQALLDRLLDVALVQLLRDHVAADGQRAPAWFRACADPQLAPALAAIHADPARPWTVAQLAHEASMSRSGFARRFAAILGIGPLAYLTDWRMALARELLRDSDDRLAAIAQAVGYGSEFAFAAAFRRRHGTAPGRWRAGAREAPAEPAAPAGVAVVAE
jgi:AraC-like DNA-binding protein